MCNYFTYRTYRVCKQGGVSVVGVFRHLWLLVLFLFTYWGVKFYENFTPKLCVGGPRVFEGFGGILGLLCIIILHTIPIGFVSRVASL